MIGSATLDLSTDPADRIAAQSTSKVTLYVHLTDDAIATSTGVARIEGTGPVTVDQIRRWLGHTHVTVKPVDRPQPPDARRQPTRSPTGSAKQSTSSPRPTASPTPPTQPDAKTSTTPHRSTPHGPPGQTRIGNLGPMTRFHHRIKTHTGWQLKQPFPGIYIWRSPHGRTYLVDHTGTRRLSSSQA